LLTDVVMPGMSGFELAECIRTARPGIKILFMSGYTERLAEHGLADSDVKMLIKPFGPTELAGAVRRILDADADR